MNVGGVRFRPDLLLGYSKNSSFEEVLSLKTLPPKSGGWFFDIFKIRVLSLNPSRSNLREAEAGFPQGTCPETTGGRQW